LLLAMHPDAHRLIASLHQSNRQCVLVVTGGGTGAAAMLLNVPGGSRTVLEVQVPYQEQAAVEFLGRPPDQFCSAATAGALALSAYDRARWLAPATTVVGLGCTASLVTDRPKHGDHRFHIAVCTADRAVTYSLTLAKGARDREGEEAVLDAVLLNALAQAFGVAQSVAVGLLPGEEIDVNQPAAISPFEKFLRGEVSVVCVEIDGRVQETAPRPSLVLPGAFNPLHAGHVGLLATVSRLTGKQAAFELSVTNVDKPPLAAGEIRWRLHQFSWQAPVWLTRAPTFADKAALFPGAAFVVGIDTALRIIAPRYYGDEPARMTQALDHIRGQRCCFLVAGRLDATGRFASLDDMDIPPNYRDLFSAIPEKQFRLDLSSTQLRAGG
jgi:hypothetical protein